ncbi:MAG: hypothetical protein WBO09_02760 [Methylocystis silviterrae]|uniref:hypothetical protein n=1 Tax=Methylocystis silviterrae TaxID=2743612 RepID=UPI003C71FB8A
MAKPNLKLATVRDPAREALGDAIADAETARKNLDDARAAAAKAEEQVWAASDRVTALRENAAQARPADAIVAALAAGNTAIAEIDRPAAETRAKIEGAESELAAWRRAREAAEAAIPVRENAHEWAQRRVKDAVAEVMRTADIDALIASAERARDTLVEQRCQLMEISEALPHFSPERKAVEAHLSHAFLMHEATGGWREHPVVAPWRNAFDQLHVDASAPLPAIATEATVVILPANGRE